MRKADIDQFATRRPFEPFEVRLVEGQRFRFMKVEQFIVGRTALVTMTRNGDIVHINMGLIATVRPLRRRGRTGTTGR